MGQSFAKIKGKEGRILEDAGEGRRYEDERRKKEEDKHRNEKFGRRGNKDAKQKVGKKINITD